MPVQIRPIDRRCYETYLADWLPPQIIDIHTHVWLESFVHPADSEPSRGATWPERVAAHAPLPDLLETYRRMFPRQMVTPVIFTMPRRDIDLDAANAYVSQAAWENNLPALLVSRPEWAPQELERRVSEGRFRGLKPYLCFAPPHLAETDITLWDFLPQAHLEVANQHGWIVILHLPRPQRLRDLLNLRHLLDIDHRYPNVRLVVAHLGRAYCQTDVGEAFVLLKDTDHLCFDFSANTNTWVMEQALRAVGPRRLLFGSDLPILRMRMRRICENGMYINLVPPGLYGDVSDDPHMREVAPEDGEALTFFMYEELLAFRRAAEAVGLTSTDLEDVFYNNAMRLCATVTQMPHDR